MNAIKNFEQFIQWFESETWQIHDIEVNMTIAQMNLTYRKRTHLYHGVIRLKHSDSVIPKYIPDWASNNFGWETISATSNTSIHNVDFHLSEWCGLDKMTTLLLLKPGVSRFNYYGNRVFDNCYSSVFM